MKSFSPFSWNVICGTLWTVIGAWLEVDAIAVTAEGVPPLPPAVEVPMLPAVAMAEDGPALAIVAFVVLAVLVEVLLIGAFNAVELAVAALLVRDVALCAFAPDTREDLLFIF